MIINKIGFTPTNTNKNKMKNKYFSDVPTTPVASPLKGLAKDTVSFGNSEPPAGEGYSLGFFEKYYEQDMQNVQEDFKLKNEILEESREILQKHHDGIKNLIKNGERNNLKLNDELYMLSYDIAKIDLGLGKNPLEIIKTMQETDDFMKDYNLKNSDTFNAFLDNTSNIPLSKNTSTRESYFNYIKSGGTTPVYEEPDLFDEGEILENKLSTLSEDEVVKQRFKKDYTIDFFNKYYQQQINLIDTIEDKKVLKGVLKMHYTGIEGLIESGITDNPEVNNALYTLSAKICKTDVELGTPPNQATEILFNTYRIAKNDLKDEENFINVLKENKINLREISPEEMQEIIKKNSTYNMSSDEFPKDGIHTADDASGEAGKMLDKVYDLKFNKAKEEVAEMVKDDGEIFKKSLENLKKGKDVENASQTLVKCDRFEEIKDYLRGIAVDEKEVITSPKGNLAVFELANGLKKNTVSKDFYEDVLKDNLIKPVIKKIFENLKRI
jgi:hypothetical protein